MHIHLHKTPAYQSNKYKQPEIQTNQLPLKIR